MSVPIIGLAVGLAGTAFNVAQQMSFQSDQDNAINEWAQWQRTHREDEYGRQDDLRGQAQKSHEQGLDDLALENQQARREEEENRLGDFLSNSQDVAPTGDVDDALLTQRSVGSQLYETDKAKQFAEASQEAQRRIQALAKAQSYGGSFGGLGTTNPIFQSTAQQGIEAANNKRRGSLTAYGNERAVEPVTHRAPTPLPVGQLASFFG